jgi:dephospho-CoA kinase
MKLIGLTGSIGMGKSTTASLFAEMGLPVYDADAAVHRLYARGGAAVRPVAELFPEVEVDGAIDRRRLSARVLGNDAAMRALEAVVHPLVGADRQAFFEDARAHHADLVVLDVPLLFETGGAKGLDAVVVASAPEDMQRDRVLARPDMDPDKFAAILARQTPDADKRARADFVVDTSRGLDPARDQVVRIIETLRQPGWTSRRLPDR